ncbi:NAD-dependent succinate-semialdehyde dehydrogenase [Echinicola vietnamensis]|uniref:NAD-dependent aldehyde dehydrogenase n=1 Tax=Echinicola vietnamensis (strain DSM 17526 / LMG 23754 / KMM 6221) TaxID=926556 RepID=L0G1H3_ECHVK|nr:NAD-dependent succinate-semialdehyde dehydrogenase [Echinicola vietnamensis]AGA80034.1 NAD-dependent aldehyde dehydrogenase [Echinicola vietnamensis DSM 17526]
MKSINPYTGELLEEFTDHTEQQVEAAIQKGQEAYLSWRELPISQRADLMKKAGQVLRDNTDKYGKIISLEMGKVITESKSEVEKCAWVCEYYAENAEEMLADAPIALPDGKEAKVVYNPLGIVLAVMPWNFPFWQVFRFAAPNLTAGNVGLLKHASNVPQCALAIEEVFTQAGFPEGVFQSLLIGSDKVANIIAHPDVKAATLTGSEKAGQKIAAQAGEQIKKTVLELGGSDPFIVLKDADVKEAAKTAAKGRMINFGQSCIAAKRFIIEQEVYDEFITHFKSAIESYVPGDPLDEKAGYACMARPDLAMELYEQVEASIQKGAEVILEGTKPEKGKAFIKPYILGKLTPDMPAYREELFGPVASVFKANDVDEAIAIANDSAFGLGASLWTQDPQKADILSRKIESGAVFINSMVASNPYLPFGGIKKSGYGRELAENGIKEFMNIKTVYLG